MTVSFQALRERELVAFVRNGAILPRASGASDLPMGQGAVAFQAPQSLEVEFELPHVGKVRGMGECAGFIGSSCLL